MSTTLEALMAKKLVSDFARACAFGPDDERIRLGDKIVSALSEALADKVRPAVAVVTECEACFTPDVCRLRGTCDHFAAERLRVASPPVAPAAPVAPTDAQPDHWSDCATHAAPAYPAGACDCAPTPSMCRAAVEYMNGADIYSKVPREVTDIEEGIYREVFLVMLAAAPPAPAAAPAEGAQWLPIESAPKDGCKIIVSYVNRNGKTRTVMARWLTDEQAAETDADGVGLEGGWYECIDNWSEYTEVAIHEGEPTHYMPLPAAPTEAPNDQA